MSLDRFLTWIEGRTEKRLTKRRAVKAYLNERRNRHSFWGTVIEYVDVLVAAAFWVIIINQFLAEFFLIPTVSMFPTIEAGDRIVAFKDEYGVELYPYGPKVADENRGVQRDDVITFYNPECESKGPVFDIMAKAIRYATLSLVNLDVNPDGTTTERMLVKRAVGLGGDSVRFKDGNVYIKVAGSGEYVPEESFRKDNGLVLSPQRTIKTETYDGLKSAATIKAFNEAGVPYSSALLDDVKKLREKAGNSIVDLYEFSHAYANARTVIDPTDMEARSSAAVYRTGIYVPEGYVLPLGDNRDNSLDGRYFGPVSEKTVNGRLVFRFWPLDRIGVTTDN